MKEYEITYLVQNEDVFKNKPVENTIEKLGGKVVSSKPWGQKNLAYTIKKLNTAYIVTDVFSIDAQNIGKLDRQLGLDSSVMRFLIVKDVKEVPNLGEEPEARPRSDSRQDYRQSRQPKVIVSPVKKPVEVNAPMPTTKEVSKEIEKIVAPKAKEAPQKTEKLVKKAPAKKAPAPKSAPSDEERLKQLENKLQDLLKE
jgi:ribosomal protein S6